MPVVVGLLGDAFPSLSKDPQHIIDVLSEEETQFRRTLVSCETVLHQPDLRNTASCPCSLHTLHQLARSFSSCIPLIFPRFTHFPFALHPFYPYMPSAYIAALPGVRCLNSRSLPSLYTPARQSIARRRQLAPPYDIVTADTGRSSV